MTTEEHTPPPSGDWLAGFADCDPDSFDDFDQVESDAVVDPEDGYQAPAMDQEDDL